MIHFLDATAVMRIGKTKDGPIYLSLIDATIWTDPEFPTRITSVYGAYEITCQEADEFCSILQSLRIPAGLRKQTIAAMRVEILSSHAGPHDESGTVSVRMRHSSQLSILLNEEQAADFRHYLDLARLSPNDTTYETDVSLIVRCNAEHERPHPHDVTHALLDLHFHR
ncbi:hypothetical protein [Erythrobacter donghaensis]|uniref:hypothetical protein n=1 Tax=Erythrobacter donghaensis TaxID=267135 RepID=UPI0009403A68|nr:hypothetical protein [Erythrobacter donghaensis]